MTTINHAAARLFEANILAAGAAVALTGCTAASQLPADDTTQVMESLVSLLTADGGSACIDSKTRGAPLAIFRTMMDAPDRARRPLSWFQPRPLRPAAMPSAQQMLDDQIDADRDGSATAQRAGRPLSNLLQGQLDAAARQLSLYQDRDRVSISAPSASRATVRWWVRNRFDQGCMPVYTASNPVVAKNVAFVSVTAGHWGTTYAFRKHAATWSPVGQWTNWVH